MFLRTCFISLSIASIPLNVNSTGEMNISEIPPSSQWCLGRICKNQGDFEKTSLLFRDLLNTEYAFAARLSFIDLMFDQREYGRALLELELLQEENPFNEKNMAMIEAFRGLIYYQLHHFEEALRRFQKSCEIGQAFSQAWRTKNLLYLGWSAILSAEKSDSADRSLSFFFQAAHAFRQIPDSESDFKLSCVLSCIYLKIASLSNNPTFLEKASEFLSHAEANRECQKGAVRFCESVLMFSKKRELSEPEREFETAKLLEEAIHFYKHSFQNALSICEKKESLQALALCYLSAYDPQYDQSAYQLLLSTSEAEGNNNDSSELCYLLGIASARLWNDHPDPVYEANALKAWDVYLNNFPNGIRKPEIMFAKACHYFQKKMHREAGKEFLNLACEFPDHHLVPESLYFLAFCLDKQGKSPAESRIYRKQIWQKFPKSSFAAEAYLTTYSRIEYLDNVSSAIDHLKQMPSLYPNSPFILPALFLIGQFYAKCEPKESLENFGRVIEVYDALNEDVHPSFLEALSNIRVRALLEKGNLLIQEEDPALWQDGIDCFRLALQNTSSLPMKSQEAKYLREEAAHCLALGFFKNDELSEANEVLDQLLENYANERITRGYFLSRSWFMKGCIAAKQNNHEEALSCFAKAQDAANGKVLSGDQCIDLYIYESLSLQALNRLDQAMLTLSKAVNENVVSSLRLKAMYLRAEIYMQQGRADLAERQLGSLSKKQGEWAVKAKERLKEIKKQKRIASRGT